MTPVFTTDPRSPDRTVRRAAVILAAGTIIAFGLVIVGSTVLAKQIARNEELSEAIRSGDVLVNTVLAEPIQDYVAGDRRAATSLDEAVRMRTAGGSLVYLEIARADGTVIYPLADTGRESGRNESVPGRTTAHLISAEEARTEIGAHSADRMVKVNIPIQFPAGEGLVRVYSTDDRLVSSERALLAKLVMLSVGAGLVMFVLNLPVSLWLLRKIGQAHRERLEMIVHELNTADRERRNIARDLHDGVIQELAGASYALESLIDGAGPTADEAARQMLRMSHDAVQRSTEGLRTLIIEVAPPDLTAETLPTAIEALTERLERDSGMTIHSAIDLRESVGGEVAALVYRVVRECLTNVVKHAQANRAEVTIRSDETDIYVVIEDDGVGFPPDLMSRRQDGHLGLSLLAGTIADLGGTLTVDRGDGGAIVRCRLPIR